MPRRGDLGGLIPVQAPATGQTLAKTLGVKGGIAMDLDPVVTPVVILEDISGSVEPLLYATVLAATLGVTNSIHLRPQVPCYLRRVWVSTPSGPADIVVNLARGVNIFVAANNAGSGRFVNSSDGGRAAAFTPDGIGVIITPADSIQIHKARLADDQLIDFDYRENPIALGPLDWRQQIGPDNGAAVYQVDVAGPLILEVIVEVQLAPNVGNL